MMITLITLKTLVIVTDTAITMMTVIIQITSSHSDHADHFNSFNHKGGDVIFGDVQILDHVQPRTWFPWDYECAGELRLLERTTEVQGSNKASEMDRSSSRIRNGSRT
ncbi:hypothetical protein SRHO_G00153970 [Serrasalmus rhombeus]